MYVHMLFKSTKLLLVQVLCTVAARVYLITVCVRIFLGERKLIITSHKMLVKLTTVWNGNLAISFLAKNDQIFTGSKLLTLRCDERFTQAFTACSCVFKVITLVSSNKGNYFQNATACSKRTLKTTVATQL